MITVRHVDFAYPGASASLQDVTLEVAAGTVVGLAGRNGSGKSTLLQLLAGILTPSRGELLVGPHGSPGAESSLRTFAGLVLQDADVQILGASVGEDLLLGLAANDTAGTERARDLAAGFGLLELWDAPVQTLSMGQKRKLTLATALRDAPRVLLLDEPFAGLDAPGVAMMRAIIADNRRQGLTQLVALHDVEALADLADGWILLDRGRVAAAGPTEAVFDQLSAHGVRQPCSWRLERRLVAWE